MTKWYINNVEITNSIVTARKINTPWATIKHEIPGQKAIVRTQSQNPPQLNIDMKLKGAGRFDMETSIRAELESTPSILIKSNTDIICDNKKTQWIIPSGFGVIDSGNSMRLECALSALIDERTIHSCDFIDNWAGTSVSADTSDTKYGKASVKDIESGDSDHLLTYTPDEPINIEGAEYIGIWIKATQSFDWFDVLRIEFCTNGNYEGWNMATSFAAETWEIENCDISLPDVSSGTVDYTNITSVRIRTNPLNETPYSIWLGWIFVE